MTDVSFVDLVVRMVLSLAIVLGVVFGAYWFLRRRQGFAPSTGLRLPRAARLGRSGATGGSRHAGSRSGAGRIAGNRKGLRVLGRVGVGRSTQVVAVQFAERVLLLGASETTAPTVLAELDLAEWTAATESHDEELPVVREQAGLRAPRPAGLLESLREATTRRG